MMVAEKMLDGWSLRICGEMEVDYLKVKDGWTQPQVDKVVEIGNVLMGDYDVTAETDKFFD